MRDGYTVLGFLGSVLDQDRGSPSNKWDLWRPSVSLFQHDDLLINKFEFIYQPKNDRLCRRVCDDINQVSPETTIQTHEIAFQDPWDFEEVFGILHDFALSYPFKPEEEDYLIHITTGTHVVQICLFLLAESRIIPARLLQTSPPSNPHKQFLGRYKIIDLDLSRYDRLASRFRQEQRKDLSFLKSGIDTKNRAFNELIDRIEKVAIRSEEPILLLGPTGAGKSQLARRIYELKKKKHLIVGDFVDVNCSTLRGDGAMSALFGHVRGAFTGAAHSRNGLLRAADNGVLMLDEIGELGLEEQAMLLRAIEIKHFFPVGADREVASDFQLIAGTNRDIFKAVRAGKFREDLLARINLWTFRLPGLRDRPEDIAPNCDWELEQMAIRTGELIRFNREAQDYFLDFATSSEALWEGNFRDLKAAIIRMTTLCEGRRISVSVVQEEIERLRLAWRYGPAQPAVDHVKEPTSEPVDSDSNQFIMPELATTKNFQEELIRLMGEERVALIDRFEIVQLADVIEVCKKASGLSEAGRWLFSESRKRKKTPNDADRLRKYLAKFGISFQKLQQDS